MQIPLKCRTDCFENFETLKVAVLTFNFVYSYSPITAVNMVEDKSGQNVKSKLLLFVHVLALEERGLPFESII